MNRLFFDGSYMSSSVIILWPLCPSEIRLRQKATWENLENSGCAHTWCHQVCICQTAQKLILKTVCSEKKKVRKSACVSTSGRNSTFDGVRSGLTDGQKNS